MSGAGVGFSLVHEEAPLILLPVEVNGEGPFDFIFDTGATHVVISDPLAERLALESLGDEQGKGAFETIKARKVRLRSVRVGDAHADEVDAVAMDTGRMQEAIPRPFDGILGYTFFKSFRVVIDYPGCRISFE